MERRAKPRGHAVHPMLITFPVGLFVTAVVFDIVYLVTGGGSSSAWVSASTTART